MLYHILFSAVFWQARVMSLEVKYDRFGYGNEGTWQKPLQIPTTKDRGSIHLKYITDVLQWKRASK